MQRSGRLHHQFSPLEAADKPNFSVVIAYEDLDTGKNARRTYDHIAHELGYDCQFINEMWNFDVLGLPRLREMAANDARQADMIIIACHGDKPLRDSVKAWMELLMTEEVNAIALVALFDSANLASSATREIREYLGQAASRCNIEFFAQTDPWPNHNRASGPLQALPSWAPNSSSDALSASLEFRQRHEAFPHWGINE